MKLTRKIYMSIFTTMFILLTCVATTFAWVGMFTTSTLGSFDMNLKVIDSKDYDYYLKISSTGKVGSFDEMVNLYEIQSQIMDNMGVYYASIDKIDEYSLFNNYRDYINNRFYRLTELRPVTPGYNAFSNYKIDLSKFYEFENLKYAYRSYVETKKYFKFDLYFTIDTPSGIQDSTSIDASVFFDNIENALEGSKCGGELLNVNPFSTIADSRYNALSSVNGYVSTNSINASRLAFEIYNPIDINSDYSTLDIPSKTVIYQGGTQLPSYNSGEYSFGGILPEEYNLALKEINKMYGAHLDITNDESALYRYNNGIEKEMTLDNRVIWNSLDSDVNYLGVQDGVQTKMKITCYFWFEGWDADCLSFINRVNVKINLVFSTDKNDS